MIGGEEARGRTGNTPPQNCKLPESSTGSERLPSLPTRSGGESGVRVLCTGIDTLRLGFKAVLTAAGDRTFWSHLDFLKGQAQAGESPSLLFGGVEFSVSSHGGGSVYGYQLRNGDWTVSLSRQERTQTPTLMFQPACEFLWEQGLEAVWLAAQEIASRVDVRGVVPEAVLSRIDLTADLQGIDFSGARPEEFVGRARSASRFSVLSRPEEDEAKELKKAKGAWKKAAEIPGADYQAGVQVSGFAFGTSPIRVRVYDKVREIKHGQNAKDFFPKKVWKGYDDSEPVWRVEVQLSREVLREIAVTRKVRASGEKRSINVKLDTLAGVKVSLGAWWRYALGEDAIKARGKSGRMKTVKRASNGWISWRARGSDETRSRWKVRDEWSAVRAVSWGEGKKFLGVRERARESKAERLEVMAIGCLSSVAALRGHDTIEQVVDGFRAALERVIGRDLDRPEKTDRWEDMSFDERTRADQWRAALGLAWAESVRDKAKRLNSAHPLLNPKRCPCGETDAKLVVWSFADGRSYCDPCYQAREAVTACAPF